MPQFPSQQSTDNARNLRLLTTVVFFGFVLTGIVNTFLGPILPILAARWELSDSRSGYFFATQFFGSFFGVGISSVMLLRRGYRFSVGFSYLFMALGVWGLALPQWKFALLGTFLFGIGFGVGNPASNLLISSLNQDRRAPALSILNLCWGVGAVVAPLALAAAERWNYVQSFVPVLSGFLVLAATGVALTPQGSLHTEGEEVGGFAAVLSEWRSVLALGAMFFLYVGIEASVGGWIATLARRAPLGGGQAQILAPALFWAGLLGGRSLAPLLLRRICERRLTLAGLAMASLGMCILVLSRHRQWITFTGALIGGGLASVFPITVALLGRFRGMEKRIAGFMFGLAALGGAIIPWLVGVLSTRYGSLRTGLLAPLLSAVVLLWLHIVENHGAAGKEEVSRRA